MKWDKIKQNWGSITKVKHNGKDYDISKTGFHETSSLSAYTATMENMKSFLLPTKAAIVITMAARADSPDRLHITWAHSFLACFME